MYLRIFYLLFLIIFNGSACSLPQDGKKKHYIFYPVTKVVDGDTFWIDIGNNNPLKIRLIGVDAPESRNTGNKVKAFYGKESSQYLTTLIGGKDVHLEYDIDRFDQYGRTLAYVYLKNGTFVNAELLKNGYAMVMTIPPNVKYADTFTKMAKKARLYKRGLWKKDLE
jgi:micrococcal nuclease